MSTLAKFSVFASLIQAASISMPVTAMGALNLVEQGLPDLDTDVNVKLTRWQVPENDFTTKNKMTLRRLLNHSAGTTVWGFPGYHSGEAVPTTVTIRKGKEILEIFTRKSYFL